MTYGSCPPGTHRLIEEVRHVHLQSQCQVAEGMVTKRVVGTQEGGLLVLEEVLGRLPGGRCILVGS